MLKTIIMDWILKMVKKIKKVIKKADAVKVEAVKTADRSDSQVLADARVRRKDAANIKGAALEGQVLNVPPKEGYVRRWVRGSEQRLDQLSKKGYSLVNSETNSSGSRSTDLGTSTSQIVGTAKDGGARRDYLMEIPEELYLEDLKIKEQKTRRLGETYSHVEHNADELATPEGRSKIYRPL